MILDRSILFHLAGSLVLTQGMYLGTRRASILTCSQPRPTTIEGLAYARR
jgi:hypothetical protein